MKKIVLFGIMLLCSIMAFAQNRTNVTGTVTDNSTGETLVGVHVQVVGQTHGAVTDVDGKYSINGVPSNGVLTFSMLGMESAEVSISGRSVINIAMSKDDVDLDEVVVIGYGTMKKSDLTGAVGSIKSDDLAKTAVANAATALQGRVAGVYVSATGAPGSAPTVRIRGIGTVNDSSPLYVVDGMFMDDITFLNPLDIESMEVLKDASATAMYGSRGANGVIIVTTKQGKKGNAKIDVIANRGWTFASNMMEMCNASEYATLLNAALVNDGYDALYTNPESYGEGTNWLDEILRVAASQEYQVSASGGTDKTTYNISVGYYGQEGIVQGNEYDRFTVRLNNNYHLNDWITVGHNISGAFSHKNDENSSAITAAYRISPIAVAYNDDGTFGDSGSASTANPVASLYYTNNDIWQDRIVGSAFINLKLTEGLNFKTSYGVNYLNQKYEYFSPEYYVSVNQYSTDSQFSTTWYRYFNWMWENILTYDVEINQDHRLNFLLGATAEKTSTASLYGYGTSFFSDSDDYVYLSQADADSEQTSSSGSYESAQSFLFRMNYVLKDKYLLTASLRADGSSVFGPDHRWGYFPSVAAGWRVSEEPFIKDNVSWLNNFKLRGSWGQIGNDKITSGLYYPLVSISSSYDAVFGGTYSSGGTTTSLSNESIHWEVVEQTDLGFELGFFDNRLTAEFDYYIKNTKDMLVTIDVPASVGLSAVASNAGTVRNSGVDFMVNWNDNIGNDFSYQVRFTGTTIKNTVTSLASDDTIWSGSVGTGDYAQRTIEGESINHFYGYDVVGIFQSQAEIDEYNAYAYEQSGGSTSVYQSEMEVGALIFEDVDGNGYIDSDDREVLGSYLPKFIGGLGISMAYKGFDLSIDLQGNFGNKIFNAKQIERYASSDNWDVSFLDAWTEDNTDTSVPRMSLSGNNYEVSSLYVDDGSYVKLQSVEVGYTLPVDLTRKIGLDNVRVYFSGSNLGYLTSYNGFSPEVLSGLDRNIYPVSTSCRLGVNLTF
ncbi:MAG: TonB-dependent receptor [Rikenellaceae bacterium]